MISFEYCIYYEYCNLAPDGRDLEKVHYSVFSGSTAHTVGAGPVSKRFD